MSILIITDLECTCDRDNDKYKSIIKREDMEIIEIGSVAFDTETKKIINEFQLFVKPIIQPKLTIFCKELTTIKQEEVDNSDTLDIVYPKFETFMNQYTNATFSCYGNFDFNQLKRETDLKNISFNIKNHINISLEVVKYFKLKRKVGTRKALALCGLEFEGTPHRGIDDARNISKIADKLNLK